RASALMMPCVSAVSGHVDATKSALGRRSGRLSKMHGIGSVRASRRIAAHPEHLHAEGFRETGQASADSAEPDNDQRLAREFVFALPEVGDHPAPVVPCLVIARFG